MRRPRVPRPADVQDVAVISAYAPRGHSPLCIKTYMKFGSVTRNASLCTLFRKEEQLENGNPRGSS